MQQMYVRNINRPLELPVLAQYCASFLCRLRGLTFRRRLPDEQGLLLVQARESRMDTAIHMFFVCFALAVVWIDARGAVVDVKLAKPWRPAYVPRRAAKYVLELSASRINDFAAGDQVIFDAAA